VDAEREQRNCCAVWLSSSRQDGRRCCPKSDLALGHSSCRRAVSVAWGALLTSYRKLNRAKFEVIEQLEADLPIPPFIREQETYGRDRRWGNFGVDVLSASNAIHPSPFRKEVLTPAAAAGSGDGAGEGPRCLTCLFARSPLARRASSCPANLPFLSSKSYRVATLQIARNVAKCLQRCKNDQFRVVKVIQLPGSELINFSRRQRRARSFFAVGARRRTASRIGLALVGPIRIAASGHQRNVNGHC
jgi:hypothetical protein